jgi:hypothetical protein
VRQYEHGALVAVRGIGMGGGGGWGDGYGFGLARESSVEPAAIAFGAGGGGGAGGLRSLSVSPSMHALHALHVPPPPGSTGAGAATVFVTAAATDGTGGGGGGGGGRTMSTATAGDGGGDGIGMPLHDGPHPYHAPANISLPGAAGGGVGVGGGMKPSMSALALQQLASVAQAHATGQPMPPLTDMPPGTTFITFPAYGGGGQMGQNIPSTPMLMPQQRPNASILRLLRHSTVNDVGGGRTPSGHVLTVTTATTVEECIQKMTVCHSQNIRTGLRFTFSSVGVERVVGARARRGQRTVRGHRPPHGHLRLHAGPRLKETGCYIRCCITTDVMCFDATQASLSPAGGGLREQLAHQRRFAAAPIAEVNSRFIFECESANTMLHMQVLAMDASQHVTNTTFSPLPVGAPLIYAMQAGTASVIGFKPNTHR